MDHLEDGLVEDGVVPGQGVVGHLRPGPLGLAVGGQGVGQLGLAAAHVGLGQAGLEMPGRDGEKVRVVVRVGVVEPAVHDIHRRGQIARGGLDGLPAARFAQQAEEHTNGVHQQLFAQQGQHAPLQRVVLLVAKIVQLIGGDGGAVSGEGAAQEEVG